MVNDHGNLPLQTNQAEEDALALIKLGANSAVKGIGTLHHDYAAQIQRFFLSRGQTETEAENLVQDVFAQVVRKSRAFRGDTPVSAWVWTIAHHQLLIRLAAQSPRTSKLTTPVRSAATTGEPAPLIDAGLNVRLQGFAAQHPEDSLVLTLVCQYAWSESEISGFLGIDLPEAQNYLTECRNNLQPFLGEVGAPGVTEEQNSDASIGLDLRAWLALLAGRQAPDMADPAVVQTQRIREILLAIERSHTADEFARDAGLQRLVQHLDEGDLLARPPSHFRFHPKTAVVTVAFVIALYLILGRQPVEFPNSSPGFLDLPVPGGSVNEQVVHVPDTDKRLHLMKRSFAGLGLPYRIVQEGTTFFIDIYLPSVRTEAIHAFLERQHIKQPPENWLRIKLLPR